MNPASPWVQEAMHEFGRKLGLDGLDMGDGGAAQLQLEAGGVLAVEMGAPHSGEVLVYLGRPRGFDEGAALRRALARAHCASADVMPVQVAVRGQGVDALLLAVVRVPERELTAHLLDRVVDYLSRWMEGVRRG